MNIKEFLKIVLAVRNAPFNISGRPTTQGRRSLYQLQKAKHATDSEINNDDIVARYENGDVVGLTVLNASKR